MKIWLATVGEPLPNDPGNPRLLRSGQFADWLAARGHEVVFLTNTMDHFARKLRSNSTITYQIAKNYRIIALQGRHYRRSISYARFRNAADSARAFPTAVQHLERPDVILASYPTEELCRAILDYAEPLGIPVVIDTRDFWPDIFEELLPRFARPLAPVLFCRLRGAARQTLRRATGLSGMTQSAMEWAQNLAGRDPRATDFFFPFSYRKRLDIVLRPHLGFRFCFLGTVSPRSNLDMVIEAVHRVRGEGLDITLDICGTGEALEALKAQNGSNSAVRFHGWVGADALAEIMAQSDMGILPYTRSDFHKSIPNKCVEYLASGLPVLSCTEGEVQRLLQDTQAGVWFRPSVDDLCAVLRQLTVDDVEAMRLSARQTYEQLFEENVVFSGALDHLTKIVANAGK